MEGVTATIITLNEADKLARCLDSVAFCDEILVVDAGSSDETVAIARAHGARVIENVRGGRSQQREVCLSNVETSWLLVVDADEVVSLPLQREIVRFLEDPGPFEGCVLPMQHWFLGRWIEHCGWWFPDYKLRLMRTDLSEVHRAPVHEAVGCRGTRIARLDGILFHRAYPSLTLYFDKFNAYTTQQAMLELARRPGLSTSRLIFEMLTRPLRVFTNLYVRGRGYKDGLPGFLLCTFSSWYELVTYAKYWELSGGPEAEGRGISGEGPASSVGEAPQKPPVDEGCE